MRKIAIVCGSFHKDEIERMLSFAKEQSLKEDLEISEVNWSLTQQSCPEYL